MVAMSFSPSPPLGEEACVPSTFIMDHNYFKSNGLSPASPPKTTSTTTTPEAVVSTETEQLSEMPDNLNNCNEDSKDMDMLDDLDALNFELFDIDMENDADTAQSFQDFLESTLDLAFNASPHLVPCLDQKLEQPNNSPSHEADTRVSHTSSPYLIPTKTCSCSDPEPSSVSVYSTCQKCSTNVCASTTRSSPPEENSRGRLKPGDYLPPLYIDTENYGNCVGTSLPSSYSSQNSACQVRNLLPEQGAATVADNSCNEDLTKCSDQSQLVDATDEIVRWLNTHNNVPFSEVKTEFSDQHSIHGAQEKFSYSHPQQNSHLCDHLYHHQRHEQGSRVDDTNMADTSTSDMESCIDELALESLIDLENYIQTTSHPSDLTIPSPLTPLSSCSSSPPSPFSLADQSRSYCSLKLDEDKEMAQNFQDSQRDVVSGLKLSFLSDPQEHLGDEKSMPSYRISEDTSGPTTDFYDQKKQLSTIEDLDQALFLLDKSVISGANVFSPCSNPSSATSPCGSMRSGCCSKSASVTSIRSSQPLRSDPSNDLSILDLFSDDHPQVFSTQDFDTCGMYAS